MKGLIEINDGQTRWVADSEKLRDALEAFAWSEDGSYWTEPEADEDHYSTLCNHVPLAECTDRDDDLPRFTWRPDLQAWEVSDAANIPVSL